MSARKNHRRRQKHARHQNAERDVIESVRENVHDSRPIALMLARKRAISRLTFPRSVKRPRYAPQKAKLRPRCYGGVSVYLGIDPPAANPTPLTE